jgi:hypothetical protein
MHLNFWSDEMSLGRLLAVGGGVDKKVSAQNKYKILAGALPDFGTKQRSSSTENKETKTMTTPSLFDEKKPGAGQGATPEQDTEMRILSVGVHPPKLNVMPLKETWLMKLKNLFRREAGRKAGPRPVQGEWPMDRIMVVRNDLSDSDYELVWSEAPAQIAGKGPKPRGEQLVGRAWKKVNPFSKKERQAQPAPAEAEPVEVA